MADAHGSGPCTRKGVKVQVLSSAPITKQKIYATLEVAFVMSKNGSGKPFGKPFGLPEPAVSCPQRLVGVNRLHHPVAVAFQDRRAALGSTPSTRSAARSMPSPCPLWPPQRFPDFDGQLAGTEWLLDKLRILLQNPMMHDSIVGVARHEQHFDSGPAFLQPIRQFPPA